MIEYDLVLAAGVAVDAWLLFFVVLRGHRPWLQATFAALALTVIVNAVGFIGIDQGFFAPSWEPVVLATLILSHPLSTILVLGLIHGGFLPRRRPVAFLLLGVVPWFVLIGPGLDGSGRGVYDLTPVGAFLVVCFGIALAEPLYQRITSRLRSADATWLLAGVIALVVGGPVYSYELEALGLPFTGGSNLAFPLALAAFALVATRTDPFRVAPRGKSRPWTRESPLAFGRVFAIDEARPAYVLDIVVREASAGRPVLLLARASAPEAGTRGLAVGRVEPGRHVASRVLTSASEFMARSPGSLVAVVDIGDVALLSGWESTREALFGLRAVAIGTKSTLLVSVVGLLSGESDDLRNAHLTWWTLPDPATEIEAILAESFGTGSARLLEYFAGPRGLHRAGLTVEHVPALVDFLNRALAGFGRSVSDPLAIQGLRIQTEAAVRGLRAFAARSPSDLAAGGWPSRSAAAGDRALVVTARDYWKGREMDELFVAASEITRPEPLFERARTVFREHLGEPGEGMLQFELAKLGRRPDELRSEDLTRLADRVAEDLVAMATVVDVPQEKRSLHEKVESIRRRLEAIAEDYQ